MSKRPLTLLLSVAALAGAGCGDDDEQPAPATTTAAAPAATTAASAVPYGTYVRKVTKADLDRTEKLRDEYGPNMEIPPTGEYRLVIAQGAAQDVLKATDPADFTIDQDIRVDGDVIRLTSYVDPNRGVYCGPEIPAQAQYTFKLSGDALELEPTTQDPCADRDSILSGTWAKG